MLFFARLSSFFSKQAPNAAQAWQQAGGEAQHSYWLYAAPVNLLVGRDSFFLTAPAPLVVSFEESIAIIKSLNQHFSALGFYFYLQNNLWFLGLAHHPEITTTPIEKVIDQDIATYLPHGEGALAWAKLQNEIQMLLFIHPVNEAREKQGLPMINSLWFYGLGQSV
ncbi:MAG: hypothetical protein ACT4OH_01080 [Methylophilaceae bacterium]